MIGRFLSEYRVHLVGLVAFIFLVRYWRAGELSELSFWILAIDCAINLAIWLVLRNGFEAFRTDPYRQRLAEIAEDTRMKSAKKAQWRARA